MKHQLNAGSSIHPKVFNRVVHFSLRNGERERGSSRRRARINSSGNITFPTRRRATIHTPPPSSPLRIITKLVAANSGTTLFSRGLFVSRFSMGEGKRGGEEGGRGARHLQSRFGGRDELLRSPWKRDL